MLPREEEPQIKVPMIDVLVAMPGFSAKEVEERATRPMEKLLWEIPGVEYIYSTSRPGESLAIVRFKVGEDMERSLVKLTQKLRSNFDRIPHGVALPLIKPKIHRRRADPRAHVSQRALRSSHAAPARRAGGRRGEAGAAGRGNHAHRRRATAGARAARSRAGWLRATSPPPGSCRCCSRRTGSSAAGGLTSENQEVVIETGAFLHSAEDVGNVVVGVFGGRPVYLREVAEIVDGAEEPAELRVLRLRRSAGGVARRRARRHAQPSPSGPAPTPSRSRDDVLRKVETLKGR